MSLKEKLYKYFDQNPIDDSSENKYKAVRKVFKISVNTASKYWIDYKRDKNSNFFRKPIDKDSIPYMASQNNELYINKNIYSDTDIKNVKSLLDACEIQEDEYDVVSWKVSKREVKVSTNSFKNLYNIEARFKKKDLDKDLNLQKQIIINELFNKSPRFSIKSNEKKKNVNPTLLELALFDVHFGKLSSKDETNEDYNLQIAIDRWNTSIDKLLSRVNLSNVERILLPIGNDLIHIDNNKNQTTAGTPMDSDSRFYKLVRSVREVLVNTINKLAKIANVDIIVVPGNHDTHVTFMLGDILKAYYNNNSYINVYNNPTPRKYYKYGRVSIMYTHGDKERFNDLGMIFAAENPKLWASTTQRYIKIGHFHHNKVQSIQRQEHQGCQIQIIPSLSNSDYWHQTKGYNSLKQAKAFLYNKDEGLIGEFTYTVNN